MKRDAGFHGGSIRNQKPPRGKRQYSSAPFRLLVRRLGEYPLVYVAKESAGLRVVAGGIFDVSAECRTPPARDVDFGHGYNEHRAALERRGRDCGEFR